MAEIELAIAVLVRHLSENPSRWRTEQFDSLRCIVDSIETESGSSDEEEMPPGDSYELARDYVRDAMSAIDSHEYAKALECAETALALNPDSVKGIRARAIALFQLNRSDEAYKGMCEAQRLDFDEEYTVMHDQMRQAVEDSTKRASSSQSAATGPAGLPAGVESLMQNPHLMAMAQNMMQNPEMMRNMMHMFNPAEGGRRPE